MKKPSKKPTQSDQQQLFWPVFYVTSCFCKVPRSPAPSFTLRDGAELTKETFHASSRLRRAPELPEKACPEAFPGLRSPFSPASHAFCTSFCLRFWAVPVGRSTSTPGISWRPAAPGCTTRCWSRCCPSSRRSTSGWPSAPCLRAAAGCSVGRRPDGSRSQVDGKRDKANRCIQL